MKMKLSAIEKIHNNKNILDMKISFYQEKNLSSVEDK